MTKINLYEYFNLSSKPLILDGAIGSLLQERGYKSDLHLWTSYVNFKYPDIIKGIHEEYINSGCNLITTNTYRTNPIALKKSNLQLDVKLAVEKSVKLSKYVSEKYKVLLCGSNAPAEDCYQEERTISQDELSNNHRLHIDLLYDSGCDLILNETFSHFDEISFVCQYCSENKIPFIISLFVTQDLKILSGENLNEVTDFIRNYNPILISFNCISKDIFKKIIKNVKLDFNWGYYLNCGSGSHTDKNISCGVTENQYAEIVKSSLNYNPKLIGTCCGSNPNHTRKIRNLLNEKTNS